MSKKITFSLLLILFAAGAFVGTFSTLVFAKGDINIRYMDQFWFNSKTDDGNMVKTDINKLEDYDENIICYTATTARARFDTSPSTSISCVKKTDK